MQSEASRVAAADDSADTVLTFKEVAAIVAAVLKTSEKQVSNMIQRKQFPRPMKIAGIGRRWRSSVVHAWLRSVASGDK